eukprot:scaffold11130_cov126-Skeletonema_menzelii.AAC.1
MNKHITPEPTEKLSALLSSSSQDEQTSPVARITSTRPSHIQTRKRPLLIDEVFEPNEDNKKSSSGPIFSATSCIANGNAPGRNPRPRFASRPFLIKRTSCPDGPRMMLQHRGIPNVTYWPLNTKNR